MASKKPGANAGKMPNSEHWEKHYSDSYTKDKKGRAGSEWNPKIANTRTSTHNKVNREDH